MAAARAQAKIGVKHTTRTVRGLVEELVSVVDIHTLNDVASPASLALNDILTSELTRLWERVSESEKVNVREIVQQKSKLESVLESVEDALLVVDQNGTISHANALALTLIGYFLAGQYSVYYTLAAGTVIGVDVSAAFSVLTL